MEWQPIETAPKDDLVLLYDNGAMRVGFWENGQWTQPAIPALRDEYGDYIPPTKGRLVLCDCLYQPTHWMPLPEPPAIVKAKIGEAG